jgi:serine protease Do
MNPLDEHDVPPDSEHPAASDGERDTLQPLLIPEDLRQPPLPGSTVPPNRGADRSRNGHPGHRLVRLLFVLAFLTMLSLALPWTVERLWYSINRARLRAEYDVAGELLDEDGAEGAGAASGQLQQVSQRVGPLVSQRVGPSVVHISTTENSQRDRSELVPRGFQDPNRFPSHGQGSGVVVDEGGFILTNRHVVYDTDSIQIKLSDGRSLPGTIVGFDMLTDLALLKVDADDLIPIQWGDSDRLKVGSFVWAVGSPFGLERSITFGILSAKHRSARSGTYHQDFLQTDAAVNPGNSGGPLVNANGKLVGINTAIMGETYQGISFAVPSNVAKDVYQRLKKDGRVTRGWLGIALENVSEELATRLGMESTRGAVVADFPRGDSPGRDAGIQIGDVIVEFNDQPIEDMGMLIRVVGQAHPRERVKLEILRDNKPVTLKLVIGERPAQ